jgi:hypothetical protein
MNDEEIDPDLIAILEQEGIETEVIPPEEPIPVGPVGPVQAETESLVPPENPVGPVQAETESPVPPENPVPQQIVVVEPVVTPNKKKAKPKSDLLEEKPEEDKLGLKKLIMDFGKTADVIVHNYDVDRGQVNNALIYFEQQVKEARAAGQKLPQAFIDGWVKLLAVKSEINTNATGVLDSVAKLIASAKNNNIIINMGGDKNQNTTINLEELLSQDRKEDEE